MIRLLAPGELPRCPEPLLGCRIETLADCYGSMQNELAADLYRSGEGGILCRFGRTLLLAGRCRPDELRGFAAMLGVTRIEGMAGAFSPPDGWRLARYPVLLGPPAASVPGERIPIAPSDRLRRVFALLCESDPEFAAEADPLSWISDLTRRRNRGRAQVYLLENHATACLSAVGGGYACLSLVAVSPSARGQGLGGRLLRLVLADCAARGLTAVTAAQNPGLVPFYQKTGFRLLEQPLLIAKSPRSPSAGEPET